MSGTDDLAEEVLTTGRLPPAAEFEVRVPVPVALWAGETVGAVFCMRVARNGLFHASTTFCDRESGGAWHAIDTLVAIEVSEGLPERVAPEPGWPDIEIFGVHGMGFHLAFPGIAAAGVEEVVVESPSGTSVFPVFEPLGFYLAVVPDPAPGERIRLMARGAEAKEAHVYDMPPRSDFIQPVTAGVGLTDKQVRREPDEAAVWLAGQLAERLARRLPAGWSVSAEADAVVLHLDGEWRGSMELDWMFDQGDPTEEAMVRAAEHVLSHVQDRLAEWSTDPWPAERSHLPEPYARIDGGFLICGFGPPGDPVMDLEPIELGAEWEGPQS